MQTVLSLWVELYLISLQAKQNNNTKHWFNEHMRTVIHCWLYCVITWKAVAMDESSNCCRVILFWYENYQKNSWSSVTSLSHGYICNVKRTYKQHHHLWTLSWSHVSQNWEELEWLITLGNSWFSAKRTIFSAWLLISLVTFFH